MSSTKNTTINENIVAITIPKIPKYLPKTIFNITFDNVSKIVLYLCSHHKPFAEV